MISKIQMLSDICSFADGRVAVAALDLDTYISTENMLPNKEGITRSAGLPTINQTQAYQTDDVLISNIRPYFKKIWCADRDGGCSNDVLVMRAKEGCDPGFLYYLLSDDNFFDYATATAKGTKMPRGDKSAIMRYEVPDLPIDVQVGISDTLSALDARIAENRAINNHLEQMMQAIFKSWFVDFDPFADGEFTESELGTIPTGWQVDRIGDLPVTVTDYVANGSFASLKENVTLLESPDYAVFVRNVDLKAGSFSKFVDEHSYHFLSKSALFGGEVIISNVGDVGSVFLCPYLSQPMTLGNNMIMLTANERKEHNYFFYLLFKHSYGAELIRSITGGSAQPKFNKTDFRSLRVVMPPFEVMDRFLETVVCLFERQSELEQEITRLAELRDTLLPRLISGELSVCDVDAK